MKYDIDADHPATNSDRHFIVEAQDYDSAEKKFIAEHPDWVIVQITFARCYASGNHEGDLSVWQGKRGRTAILCQYHGENPPSA